MPKEVIRGKHYEPGNETDVDKGTTVDVTWGRMANHVNLASVLPNPSDVIARCLTEIQLELSVGEINQIAEELAKTLTGWWVELDRAGINALITVLRRARDAAFGKDV